MIIILNSPEIAELLKKYYSDLNPDTPFDPKALTQDQRFGIERFIYCSFWWHWFDDPEEARTAPKEIALQLQADPSNVALLGESFDRCIEPQLWARGLMDYLSHVTVSPGATSLWLHFDN